MLDFSIKHWKIGVMTINKIARSQGSSVSIVTDYGLDDLGGWSSSPSKAEEFSFPYSIQTGSGALSPGIKWPGCEADSSPSSSAKVKKTWFFTSTPPYVFMAWCLMELVCTKLQQ
jgi:hypothetical protein